MSHRAARSQAGFSLIEVMIAIAIASLTVVTGLETLTTSSLLATESRLHLRASGAYREGQAAIGAALRNAAIDTLAGFDGNGASRQLRFRRVVGIEAGVVQHGEELVVSYRDHPGMVRNVPGLGDVDVGDIVLSQAGEEEQVLARNALRTAFEVRQDGRSLVVRLGLLHGANPQRMKHVEGHTVVSLRN